MTKVYNIYGLSSRGFSNDVKNLLHNALCVHLQERLSIESMSNHTWVKSPIDIELDSVADLSACHLQCAFFQQV